MPTQIRNIPTDSATYKGGMKRLPLKRIRLALALLLTVSLSIVSLTWWFFHQRASFDRVRLSLGREGTLASVGQIEFRNDGVATLTLEEKGSIEFTFNRVAFERALFRYRRLKHVAPPGPGLDAPGFSIIVDDEGERYYSVEKRSGEKSPNLLPTIGLVSLVLPTNLNILTNLPLQLVHRHSPLQ